jgi:hypothetical protein
LAADVEPADVWQPDIEQDKVRILAARQFQGLLACPGPQHREPLAVQAIFQAPRHSAFIFND